MKIEDIKTSITDLQGVGPEASKNFAKLNIFTVGDLLKFYPRTYEDRRKRIFLNEFQKGKVHTIVQVTAHEWFGYGNMKTLKILVSDGTASASLICFNRPFMQKSMPIGSIFSITGTFTVKYGSLQSTDFETAAISSDIINNAINRQIGNNASSDSSSISFPFSISKDTFNDAVLPDSCILPVYPLTHGLTQKIVRKAVSSALKHYSKGIDIQIPEYITKQRNLLPKTQSLKYIHQPQSPEELKNAQYSLVYEELFNFQKIIAERTLKHKGYIPDTSINENDTDLNKNSILYKESPEFIEQFKASLSPLQKQLNDSLPFMLTHDQKQVITEMNIEIDKGYLERNEIINENKTGKIPFTMQRLLQGDVGSGKTLVAFFACLRAISWKGQCAFIAPTELLAKQHAENAAKQLEPLGIKVAFLTGNIKSKGRANLLDALKKGEVDLIIGTHALFSQDVMYNDLQLVIIDEQHRFGVAQRQAIVNKGRNGIYEPHLLMMSATPIPQTLALTVFGDLDVSTIRTMPKNRKPIQTYLICEGHEMNAYNEVRKQLMQGRQAYFVYPAINSENTTEEYKSAEEAYKTLSKTAFKDFKCALIHSKISEEEQTLIQKNFKEGKIQILFATTVIEVGIDVPNATSIVIEQADHFGLAQLHQLRGRVGRGSEQSYCFLIYSKKITEIGTERMKVIRQNTDGFYIANQDLKLRGPGEINGTLQAGNLDLGIADISRDYQILLQARSDAFNYIKEKHKLITQQKP